MKRGKILAIAVCAILFVGAAFALDRTLPRPFREYPGIEYSLGEVPLPPDAQEKTEWAFARMMFPGGWLDGYRGRELDWHTGVALWSQDFPRADRHFSLAVRRLTRIHVRSVEQAVNLDDGDDVYNWPWLYAVQVGEWGITDDQAKKLRDYLLRGGFFMADDFHGTQEWSVFEESMHRVFPDRSIVDIPDSDAVFHTVYDLDDRYQIVGNEHLAEGHKLERVRGTLARHLRRQAPSSGDRLVQLRYWRFVGVGGFTHLSRKVFRARYPARHQQYRLCHDTLKN